MAALGQWLLQLHLSGAEVAHAGKQNCQGNLLRLLLLLQRPTHAGQEDCQQIFLQMLMPICLPMSFDKNKIKNLKFHYRCSTIHLLASTLGKK